MTARTILEPLIKTKVGTPTVSRSHHVVVVQRYSSTPRNKNLPKTVITAANKKNGDKTPGSNGDPFSNVKPYSDVPKPKGFPIVGTVLHYIFNGGGKFLHEYVQKRHRQLGPIYKEKYSTEPFEVLFIGDVEGMRDIYKNEGKTPLSFIIGGEQLYMKLSGEKRGLLFNQGDDWLQLRRPMNHLLLKRSDYYDNFDLASQLIHEHLDQWSDNARKNHDYVLNLGDKINKMGLITFGAFAFGDTFKVHQHEIEKDAQEFYQMTKDYWKANMTMQIIPPTVAHKLKLPTWSRFETAISKMLNIGRRWTKIAKADNLIDGSNACNGFLHLMLKEDDDSENETTSRIFSDFIAALESETTMIQWIVYAMGRNPEAQEKVWTEIQAVTEGDANVLTWRQVEDMPFLTSCIKESLRMYPSNCFTVRILPEDSVVKGYRVPGGTIAAVALMSAQREPSIFPNPDTFWPERWFRSTEENAASSRLENAIGKRKGVHGCQPYLPFAWGSSRGCIFRKISTKRMTLFLANLVKSYSFRTSEVKPIMRSLMIPDRDMNFKIIRRK